MSSFWRGWGCSCSTISILTALDVLFIAQRLHRIEARRTPGWVECGEQRKHKCHDHDCCRLSRIHVSRTTRQEVELGRKQLRIGEPGEELPDAFNVETNDYAKHEPYDRPDHPDGSAGNQEYTHDRTLGCTHCAQDGNVL